MINFEADSNTKHESLHFFILCKANKNLAVFCLIWGFKGILWLFFIIKPELYRSHSTFRGSHAAFPSWQNPAWKKWTPSRAEFRTSATLACSKSRLSWQRRRQTISCCSNNLNSSSNNTSKVWQRWSSWETRNAMLCNTRYEFTLFFFDVSNTIFLF